MDIIEDHYSAYYTPNHSSLYLLSQQCSIIYPANKNWKLQANFCVYLSFLFNTESFLGHAVTFSSNYSLFTFIIMALIWALCFS